METYVIAVLVATGLLLAATNTCWARPRRTHSLRGVAEAIDCPSQTITIKSKDGAAPLTFVWNESTRFSRKGGCAKCILDSGQTVRVSYSSEFVQNVLRDVSTKGASGGCCAVCKYGCR